MGRFITGDEDTLSALDSTYSVALFSEPSDSPVHDYMLGRFGSGNRKIIFESGVWTSPITGEIRVTCIGAGGGGSLTNSNGIAEDGGTTSFDTALSATGGHGAPPLGSGGDDGGAGGQGIGGDVNTVGGQGGSNLSALNGGGTGGGGVATPKGDGGTGGGRSSPGLGLYSTGGAGGDSSQSTYRSANAIPAFINVSSFPLFNASFTRYLLPAGYGMDGPFSLIGGDGGSNAGVGSAQGTAGGGGGGGYHRGGECGYGDKVVSSLDHKGGDGGLGGGGGGGAGIRDEAKSGLGGGGGGCAVKVLTVSEGQQFNVTVGQGGNGATYNDRGGNGGDGMIIVEW